MNRINGKQFAMLLVFFLVFVAPFLLLLIKSISFGWAWPQWKPDKIDFRAWHIIFTDPDIVDSIKTTIIIGTAVVVLNFLLAIPAAGALSRYNFKGKTFIESVLLMPILIPVLAIAMGMHLTMIRLGLADRMAGVILIHLLPTLPYAIRMLKAGFDRLSIEWNEQAATLGAQKGAAFWTVTFPLLLPSIRSTALLVFVISLSQYVLTAIIGGGQVTTLPMIYYPYFNSADEAVIAGFSAVFALLPILFLTIFEGAIQVYLQLVKRP
ncbi:ABC transporter permease [Bacillus marinisedimentorum]|uniref:ABC transporter permease n=1 Tax=Bacillus marinisedimentorum TaxID=1821260 RepID=UPI001FDF40B8|nr:ABC transporter permease subunit [Bacillus marinisedimentorum]